MDSGVDRGMRVLSYLISGVVVYGLLGWLGDHLLGTAFLLPIGIVLGAAMGVFVIIRRYGRVADAEAQQLAAAPAVVLSVRVRSTSSGGSRGEPVAAADPTGDRTPPAAAVSSSSRPV